MALKQRNVVRRRLGRYETLLWTAVAIAITFPFLDVRPRPGTDPSWRAGLVMAHSQGLRFGRDIVFTYGPLGFLSHPEYWGSPSIASIVVAVLVLVGGIALGTRWLQRSMPTLVAAILAGAVVHVAWLIEPSVAIPITFVLATSAITFLLRNERPTHRRLLIVGAIGGVLFLMKTDSFLMSAVVIVAMTLGGRAARWRTRVGYLAVAVSSFSIATIVCWFGSGQHLGDFGRWLGDSAQIATGFNEAMVFRNPPFSPYLAVLLTALLLILLATKVVEFQLNRDVPGVAKLVASTGVLVLIASKSGFVRFDGHAYRYVLFLVTIALGLLGAEGPRTVATGSMLTNATRLPLLNLVGAAAFVVFAFVSTSTPRPPTSALLRGPANVVDAAKLIGSSTTRNAIMEKGRSSILLTDPVSEAVQTVIKGERVHAESGDIATLWALGNTKWTPTPIIQSYSAYTVSLDNRNAATYRDAVNGPDIVLYRSAYGDGHHPRFTSPRAIVDLVCTFRFEPTNDPKWDVFSRVGNRCGPAASTSIFRGRLDQPFDWKPSEKDADFLILGSFSIERGSIEKLTALVRPRPRTWEITFETGESAPRFRFDPLTATQPHVLAVPRCLRGAIGNFDSSTYDPVTIFQSDDAPKVAVTLTVTRVPYECEA